MTEANLNNLFPTSTWEPQHNIIAHANYTFISSDMLVALLFAETAGQAADRFPEAQQDIKNYRTSMEKPPDCYLLMIIPRLTEDDYGLVRRALDDTLVCRKIIIPLDGSSATDAIRRHFPLVAPAKVDSLDAQAHLTEAGGPTDDDLELLDKQSPPNIADQLIDRARARLRRKAR
jgi:hypothetical protein